MNSISSFYYSMCSITPSNKEMLAKEVQPLKDSEEELCQFLKDLDSVEQSLQNTDKEIKIMRSINDQRVNAAGGTVVVLTLFQTVVTTLSLVDALAKGAIFKPHTVKQVFGIGTLLSTVASGVTGIFSSRYSTGLEKGYGLAKVRINRLYEKVNNIQRELISLKEKRDLVEDELKQIESTIKQLEIAEKKFKELADYILK